MCAVYSSVPSSGMKGENTDKKRENVGRAWIDTPALWSLDEEDAANYLIN